MSIVERVQAQSARLTRADRRVAEVILGRPEVVGFGTVADVAAAAGVGTATVTRFAVKLDFDGYGELQEAIRRDLEGRLRPAAERIREHTSSDDDSARAAEHVSVAARNVRATFDGMEHRARDEIVERLCSASQIVVLSGAASAGVVRQFVNDLGQLRPNVVMLDGNEVEVSSGLALSPAGSVLIAVDVRRYDRWLVEATRLGADRGMWVLAVTDSVLSPLARHATRTVTITADSITPFDSHVGTLALVEFLVGEVARRSRRVATDRLDRLESIWRDTGALRDP
jgi:DNA-binding MurR/RpiR family transcriptional regulator